MSFIILIICPFLTVLETIFSLISSLPISTKRLFCLFFFCLFLLLCSSLSVLYFSVHLCSIHLSVLFSVWTYFSLHLSLLSLCYFDPALLYVVQMPFWICVCLFFILLSPYPLSVCCLLYKNSLFISSFVVFFLISFPRCNISLCVAVLVCAIFGILADVCLRVVVYWETTEHPYLVL